MKWCKASKTARLTGNEAECRDMEAVGLFAISVALLMSAGIAAKCHVPADVFTTQSYTVS